MTQEEKGLPPARDFAPNALKRAIRAEALTHPLTLYPSVVGVLGGLAWALFGSPLLLGVAFGGIVVGLSGLTVNYFFRDRTFAKRYVEQLKKMAAEREQALLDGLRTGLQACQSIPGAEEYAAQALEQFVRIGQKYDNIMKLLDQKLGSGELALGGIWAAAEQVHLGVLENLRRIEHLLQGTATIDETYIHQRLDRLSQLAKLDEADIREVETLKKRKALREELLHTVNELLTQNEEALTQLEETAVAVAGIPSEERFTSIDTLDSVKRLRELATAIYDRPKQ
jgi:hypothetical protein